MEHTEIMTTFARRLKQARIAAGYDSAQGFAAVLGLKPHTYRKYERGHAEMSYDVLIRTCALLRITPNDLFPLATAHANDDRSHGSAVA